MAAGGVRRRLLIEGPEVAVGVDAGGADVDEPGPWGTGALDHGPGILESAPGAVDDHIEAAPLQPVQVRGLAAIPLQVLHTGWQRLPAAGEQGQLVAGRQQLGHQGPTDEAGSPHHQDLQDALPAIASPFKRCSASVVRSRLAAQDQVQRR